MHTASVLKPGEWEVGVDTTATLQVNLLAYAASTESRLNQALAQRAKQEPVVFNPTPSIAGPLALSTLAADPPAPVVEGSVRYGLPFPPDVGIPVNQDQLRADFFVRLFQGTWHGVAGVGYMHKWYYTGPLALVALTLLGPLQRDDVDLAVLVGRDWRRLSIYFGVKAMYSNFSGSALAELASPDLAAYQVSANLQHGRAQSFIPGIVAGLQAGPPRVRFTFEVDAARTIYSSQVLGQNDDLGAYMLLPTVGIVFHPE